MTEESPAEPQGVPDGACADVAEDAEAIAAVLDLDRQDVLLVKSLPELTQHLRDMTCDDNERRVIFAANRALVAICERVARAMRRDLMADKG